MSTAVGNEGGYAPHVDSIAQVFDMLILAIERSGYKPGEEIGIALDVGASELYSQEKHLYMFELDEHFLMSDQLITLYREWSEEYPIFSIEDGLDQDDWDSWVKMSSEFYRFKPKTPHNEMLVVGDDLLTTNIERLKISIPKNAANACIVKPNQIGTLLETIKFVKYAQKYNYKIITSHRSGETTDDIIADLSIALNSDFVKFGSLSRGERTCKYNRLMYIERELSN
jgi:enolase